MAGFRPGAVRVSVGRVVGRRQQLVDGAAERKEFEIVEDFIEGRVLRDAVGDFKDSYAIFTFLDHLTKGLSIIWDRNIVHRDLKPENLLMTDNTEEAELKIVDFGLSKIIGPNETSDDPFGTLVTYFQYFKYINIVLCCS